MYIMATLLSLCCYNNYTHLQSWVAHTFIRRVIKSKLNIIVCTGLIINVHMCVSVRALNKLVVQTAVCRIYYYNERLLYVYKDIEIIIINDYDKNECTKLIHTYKREEKRTEENILHAQNIKYKAKNVTSSFLTFIIIIKLFITIYEDDKIIISIYNVAKISFIRSSIVK